MATGIAGPVCEAGCEGIGDAIVVLLQLAWWALLAVGVRWARGRGGRSR